MPIIAPDAPKTYDIDAARKAGVPEDAILAYFKANDASHFDFDGATKAGIPIGEINDHIAKKVNDPQFNVPLLKQRLSNARDEVIDTVRPLADSVVTAGVGSLNPIAGFAAGAGIDALLSKLKSKEAQGQGRTTLADLAGTEKGGIGEAAANGIQNNGINELLGGLFNKLQSAKSAAPVGSAGLRSLEPTFSQYNDSKLAQTVENIWNPKGKADALQNSANLARKQAQNIIGLGVTPEDAARVNTPVTKTVESRLIDPETKRPFLTTVVTDPVRPVNLRDQIQATQAKIPQIDSILKDSIKTQKTLSSGEVAGLPSDNMRRDLSGYRLQQIWQAADNGVNGINGKTLLNEWNNPDYATTKDQLFSKETQKQVGEFFGNVAKVADSGNKAGYQQMRMTMRGVELGSGLLTSVISGNPLHTLGAAGTFAAMEIPMMGIARILSNPAKAQVLQKLVSGAPLEASQEKVGRLLMSGLNGITVNLLDDRGNKVPAKIKDGKIE